MKQHLNTLFIQTEGAYLSRQRQTLLVRVDDETRLRVPIHTIGGVVCFGRINASSSALELCAEEGVSVSFCTEYGRLRFRATGFTPGNVLLRRDQYRSADCHKVSLRIAIPMVAAKITNSRAILLRARRDHGDFSNSLERIIDRLADSAQCSLRAKSLDELRGFEGDAASDYFGVLDQLITLPNAEHQMFAMQGRSRRPPLNRFNALLSFLYAMLANDARTACEAAGLDPAVGFLHRDRPGRPSLALDLMEELRGFLCDRLVLSMINRRQIKPENFELLPTGPVRLLDEPRKQVVIAYQKRKQESITHPYLNEKVSVGILIHLQARLLSRVLRGELADYPPFIWK
jgi:CRISP-associated protein Cas1